MLVGTLMIKEILGQQKIPESNFVTGFFANFSPGSPGDKLSFLDVPTGKLPATLTFNVLCHNHLAIKL